MVHMLALVYPAPQAVCVDNLAPVQVRQHFCELLDVLRNPTGKLPVHLEGAVQQGTRNAADFVDLQKGLSTP